MKKYLVIFTALLLLFAAFNIVNHQDVTPATEDVVDSTENVASIKEDGKYYSKEDVKEYLITYKKLPSNFVTKKEAKRNGWNPSKNKLSDVMEGYCIGGDKFGNREKLLPMKKGRQYYECDIDYKGGKRNAKRIVFSNDGLIFYTDDHYKSFEKLYGDEK